MEKTLETVQIFFEKESLKYNRLKNKENGTIKLVAGIELESAKLDATIAAVNGPEETVLLRIHLGNWIKLPTEMSASAESELKDYLLYLNTAVVLGGFGLLKKSRQVTLSYSQILERDGRLTQSDFTEIFNVLMVVADKSFPEIMKRIWGSNKPQGQDPPSKT